MAFRYQFFISYSSADRPWVSRLHAELTAARLRVFMDQRDLEAGKKWPDQLLAALRASQHVVVVWTDGAATSQWVHAELATFDSEVNQEARSTAAGRTPPDRHILPVLLQGEMKVYASVQALADLRGSGYAVGLDPVPAQAAAVADVRSRLARVAQRTAGDVALPVATVAMTAAEAARLTGAETIGRRIPQTLDQFLAALGLGTVNAIRGWYGPERTDWRPFGGPDRLADVLDRAVGALNALPGVRLRREDVDFLSLPYAEATAALKAFDAPLAMVVVDPLSLYETNIARDLNLLDGWFRRHATLVLTLPPFRYPNHGTLSDLVRQAGAPLFDAYYDPPVPSREYAMCAVNLADPLDIERMLRRQLGQYVKGRTAPPANAILDAAEAPS
jgi:hypothetical protein